MKTKLYLLLLAAALLAVCAFSQTREFIYVGGAADGSGLTNLNASNLASGTVPDARLSDNVATNVPLDVIYDNDFGSYYDMDDYAMLSEFQDRGLIRILAVGSCRPPSSTARQGIVTAEAFFNYFGINPVFGYGQATNTTNFVAQYISLPAKFQTYYQNPNQVTNVIAIYRSALVAAPKKVVFLMNGTFDNLKDLLSSPADAISTMNGLQLFTNKVSRVVLAAGDYPTGQEGNIVNSRADAKLVFTNLSTVPIHWIGDGSLGTTVRTLASAWTNKLDAVGPYFYASTNLIGAAGAPAWDGFTVMIGVNGTNYLGSNYWAAVQGSNNIVQASGSNFWTYGSGNQWFYTNVAPVATISNTFNSIVVRKPNSVSRSATAPLPTIYPVSAVMGAGDPDDSTALTVHGSSGQIHLHRPTVSDYAQMSYYTGPAGTLYSDWSIDLRASDYLLHFFARAAANADAMTIHPTNLNVNMGGALSVSNAITCSNTITAGNASTVVSAIIRAVGDKSGTSSSGFQGVFQGASGGANPKCLFVGYDTTSNFGQIQATVVGTAVSPLILNPAGGNIGIGTTTTPNALTVSGSGSLSGAITATNGVFGASGTLSVTTQIVVSVVSGTYTNILFGTADYTKVFGGITASTDGALTNAVAGNYLIQIGTSFSGAGGTTLYEGAVFTNGVECTIVEWERDVSSSSTGNANAMSIVTLPANCRVDFRVKNGGSESATFKRAYLNLLGAN